MENKVVDEKIVKAKLEAFKKLVNSCVNTIGAAFPWFKAIKVAPTISAVGGVQRVNLNKDNALVCSIDFNARDVLTKNSAELTGVVYKRLYGAALQWKNSQESGEKEKAKAEVAEENKPQNDGKSLVPAKTNEIDVTKREAKRVIAGYIKGILKDKYYDQVKKSLLNDNYAIVANAIADRILDKIEEKDADFAVKDVVKAFFDLSKLDKIAQGELDETFGEVVKNARLSCIANKVDQLSLVPGKELVALGYAQQYQALQSNELANQFRNLKINDIDAVKKYCESIAQKIMNRAGLKNITITYNNEGALGEYIDRGYGNHSLNINLSRIKSISELTMTVTHELTHATDSAVNQVNAKLGVGQINERTGTGLINNIQESVAGSGLASGSEGYNFLLRLKKFCYHINPNERHARENELSSLMFMCENVGDNANTKEEILKSIRTYVNYQNNTINMCKPDKIDELENEFNALNAKGALTDKAVSMIKQRLDYLRQLGQNGFFDTAADEAVMLEADKLYEKLTGKSLLNKRLQAQVKNQTKTAEAQKAATGPESAQQEHS